VLLTPAIAAADDLDDVAAGADRGGCGAAAAAPGSAE